jgi:hypothetical protein
MLLLTTVWHLDLLLGNDRETNNYTMAVIRPLALKLEQSSVILCAVRAEIL